jgi:exodeoxyribonuclease III
MRIVSWNVNGIKSAQGAIRAYLEEEKPDVLCINELKVTRATLTNVVKFIIEGPIRKVYDAVWNPCRKGAWHGTAVIAKKSLRMKVLATALEVRSKPGNVSPWLEKSALELGPSHIREGKRKVDEAEIIKAHQEEGRLLAVELFPSTTDEDDDEPKDSEGDNEMSEDSIVLVATYVPNSGVNFRDPLKRLAYRVHHWDCDVFAFLLDLEKTYAGRVIWCGDLNVIHREKDVSFFKRRIGCAGATNDERASFDGFLGTSNFVDGWRYLHPDEVGYSFYNVRYPVAGPLQRGKHFLDDGWRLDYFVVHSSLMDRVKDATIDLEDDSLYAAKGGSGLTKSMRVSDHLPISLYLDL